MILAERKLAVADERRINVDLGSYDLDLMKFTCNPGHRCPAIRAAKLRRPAGHDGDFTEI